MERTQEPTLIELLNDPMVMIMMDRDGYDRDHLLQLFREVRRNLVLKAPERGTQPIAA